MAKKPATPCTLEKGKFLGGQKNFADTFNWLVSFCSNLKGKGGIKVDVNDTEKPVIKPEKTNLEDGVEVVVRVEYDQETHTFKQYTRKLPKLCKFIDDAETGKAVFVATKIES